MKIPKELIKEIVKEEKFTSTNQIMERSKKRFLIFWKKYSNVKLINSQVMKNANANILPISLKGFIVNLKSYKNEVFFPNDGKYFSQQLKILKKWTMRYRNWDMILSQLEIMSQTSYLGRCPQTPEVHLFPPLKRTKTDSIDPSVFRVKTYTSALPYPVLW